MLKDHHETVRNFRPSFLETSSLENTGRIKVPLKDNFNTLVSKKGQFQLEKMYLFSKVLI